MAGGARPDDAATVRRLVTIVNERGLHARAAARFCRLAAQFDARVTVTKGGVSVTACSIMGLMMLAAAPGCTIALAATGPDAGRAVEALAGLVRNRFHED